MANVYRYGGASTGQIVIQFSKAVDDEEYDSIRVYGKLKQWRNLLDFHPVVLNEPKEEDEDDE